MNAKKQILRKVGGYFIQTTWSESKNKQFRAIRVCDIFHGVGEIIFGL